MFFITPNNSSGTENIAIGKSTLQKCTDGSNNTAIGNGADFTGTTTL